MEHCTSGSILHSTKNNGLTTSGNCRTQECQYNLLIQTDQTDNRLPNMTMTLPMETTPIPITTTRKTTTANHIRAIVPTLRLLTNTSTVRETAATDITNTNTKTADLRHHQIIPTTTTTSIMLGIPSETPFVLWA